MSTRDRVKKLLRNFYILSKIKWLNDKIWMCLDPYLQLKISIIGTFLPVNAFDGTPLLL